ncbi:MAG: T9SS type A sorting domain-containing protein [Bacteroidia bacterium]|nr:T9SS type A sorting domain-containing protein [Bacteroidia bacterium]
MTYTFMKNKKSTNYNNSFKPGKKLFVSFLLFLAGLVPMSIQAQNVSVSGALTGNGSYADVASAFSAINAGAQTGATISIQILASTTETGSAILNAGTWSTLSIVPSGGSYSITGNIAGALLDLNGADKVLIDGLNSSGNALSLVNSSTVNTGASTIRFMNDATFNTITRCTILGAGKAATFGTITYSTGVTLGNSNNNVSLCNIGPVGTSYHTIALYSLGSAGFENKFNTLTNCNVFDYFNNSLVSIGVLIAGNNSNWTINSNKLYQTATRTYTVANTHKGIAVGSGNGNVISNNIVGYASSAQTGTTVMSGTIATRFIAIEISAGTLSTSVVQGNTVSAITLSTSSGAATTNGIVCGINVIGLSNVNVLNNLIGATTGLDAIKGFPTTSQGLIVGINCSSTGAILIQNNFVGACSSSGTAAAVAGGVSGINISGIAASMAILSNTLGNTTANNMRSGTANLTTGSSIGSGINLTSTSNGIINISNNLIQNYYSYGSGTGSYVRGIWTGSGTGNVNTYSITANTITNLSTNSGLTTLTNGLAAAAGIVPAIGNNDVVASNTISNIACTGTATTASYAVGISPANGTNTRIFNNRISNITNSGLSTTATAPAIAGGIIVRSGTNDVLVYNNFISLGLTSAANTAFVGILCQHGSTPDPYDKFYFNTIVIGGTVTTGAISSFGIHRGDFSATVRTQSVDIRNNLVYNARTGGTGNHLAIGNNFNNAGSAVNWPAGASDYNAFYCLTSNIGYWNGALHTLAGWQVNSSCDASSFTSTAITFSNAATGDLHINMGTTPTILESGGQTITGLSVDIDNQNRPGPTSSVNGGGVLPDIGADEFDGAANDMLPPLITYSPLSPACSAIDRTLTATIIDVSGVPSTGSLVPQIYYKKNAGSYVNASGVLASGTASNGVWNFAISSASMGGLSSSDQVSYFVIAQDAASTVHIASNPSAGLVATNVTSVTTPPTLPNSYLIASMSGTYTIGAAGNYTSLTAAANAYNTSCLAGPVTFRLIDANYSTAETFPIVFGNNLTTNATNSLLIIPATGTAVTISPTLTTISSVIKFLDARFITIDGLNTGGSSISIFNSNTGSASANLWLASTANAGLGCKNIALKNLIAVGGSTTQSNGIIASVDGLIPSGTGGSDNDNITIQGNNVTNCFNGMLVVGTSSVSSGAMDNLSVISNTFGPASSGTNNLGGSGIVIAGAVNPTVTGNVIQNIYTGSTAMYAINLNSNNDGFTVSQNTLNNIYSSATSSGLNAITGIYLGINVINGNIQRNTITNVYNTNTGGYGARGIMANTSRSLTNVSIQNNFIANIVSYSDASAIYWPIGIDLEGSTGSINVDFNTVSLDGSYTGLTSATGAAPLYMNATGGNINIRNNIFSNAYDNSTSTTDISYGVYFATATTNIASMNYNNYYVGGGASSLVLGYTGSNRTTMSALQTGFGQNLNSVNFAPAFTSSVDLHLVTNAVANAPFNNTGLTISGITNDLDGQTRNTSNPDIGADEFTASGTCTSAVGGTIDVNPANFALCTTNTVLLNSSGMSAGLGTSYNWQISTTSGGTYTNVAASSGTNLTYYATLPNGIYYFVLQSSCANTSAMAISNEATVTIGSPNPVLTNSVPAVCASIGSATLLATGAVSYTWSNGPTTASNVVTQTATTIYTLTGSSACGTGISTVSVIYANPIVTLTPSSASICSGQSTGISASGAGTYSWSTGASTSSISITPTASTVYSVTGTDSYGCQNSGTQSITVNGNPTLNISGSTGICTGQNASLTASGANTYTWNTSSNSSSIVTSPAINTTYTVTGTNAQGCSSSTTQLVTVAASLSITITGPSSVCAGQPVTLSGAGGVTYTWNTGASTTTIAPSPSVTTSYSVIGASGTCSNTATKLITVNANPTISVSGVNVICAGQSATLSASGAATYTWLPSTVASSIVVTPSINTTYTVNAASAQGCTTSITSAVTSNSLPAITVSQSSGSVCLNSPATFTASGANSYTWSTSSNASTISITPTASANYSVSGTNAAGCVNTQTFTLGTYTLPVVSSVPASATVCAASQASFAASGANTYTWNGTVVSPTVSFNPTSTVVYTLSGENTFGCVSTTTVGVSTNPVPVVSVSPSSLTVCAFAPANFTASGAATYTWNSVNTGSSVTLFIGSSGTQTVVGTNAQGCSATVTVAVNANPLPTVGVNPSFTTVCAFSPINFLASGATTYSWSNGASNASVVISPSATGAYTVTGTDANGCSSSTTAIVVTNTLPLLSVSPNSATLCALSPFTATASGALSYTWSGGATTNTVLLTPGASTVYTVSGTDPNNGCVGTQTVAVTTNSLPVITVASSAATVCSGSSVDLNASGANTYTWLVNGANTASISVTPSAPTVYTVSGSNSLGCTSSKTIDIGLFQLPNVLAGPAQQTICLGETASLTASGALSYTWQPGNVSSAGFTSTPTSLTQYSVIGTDANSCTNTAVGLVYVSACTGIRTVSVGNSEVLVFPNPSNGIINALFEFEGRKTVQIFNELGQCVETRLSDNTSERFDLSLYAKGVYYVKIKSQLGLDNFKVIVQ